MSNVRITISGQETIDRVNKILAGFPGGASKAITAAAKRAGEHGKSMAGTYAAQKYTISKGVFMENVKTKLQVSDGFTLDFTGGVIPLKRYKAKDQKPKGVFATVKAGSGGILPHAFTGPGDHFFERGDGFMQLKIGKRGKPLAPRQNIEKLFGPSAAHMMQNDEVIEQMDKVITETFEKRMEVEINRILAGL